MSRLADPGRRTGRASGGGLSVENAGEVRASNIKITGSLEVPDVNIAGQIDTNEILQLNGLTSSVSSQLSNKQDKVGDGTVRTDAATVTGENKLITAGGVKASIDALITNAPATLDTITELATALTDDTSLATGIMSAIGAKEDPLTFTSASAAAGGALSRTGNTVTYTPPALPTGTAPAAWADLATDAESAAAYQPLITASGRLNADLVGDGSVSSTEYGHLNGVTSAVQTQLDAKQATIDSSARLNADLVGDGSVSSTEFGYLNGVTSALQTQIDSLDPLPSQTNNSGKYLTTDGSTASWGTVSAGTSLPATQGYHTGDLDGSGGGNDTYVRKYAPLKTNAAGTGIEWSETYARRNGDTTAWQHQELFRVDGWQLDCSLYRTYMSWPIGYVENNSTSENSIYDKGVIQFEGAWGVVTYVDLAVYNAYTASNYVRVTRNGWTTLYSGAALGTGGINMVSTGDVSVITYSGACTTNSAWTTSSDGRLKSREAPITNGLETILQLQGKKYEKHTNHVVAYDDEDSDLTGVQHFTETGLVAQEVMKIPELAHIVTENTPPDQEGQQEALKGKKIYGVRYNDLTAYLIEAIKDLHTMQAREYAHLEGVTNGLVTDLGTKYSAAEAQTRLDALNAATVALQSTDEATAAAMRAVREDLDTTAANLATTTTDLNAFKTQTKRDVDANTAISRTLRHDLDALDRSTKSDIDTLDTRVGRTESAQAELSVKLDSKLDSSAFTWDKVIPAVTGHTNRVLRAGTPPQWAVDGSLDLAGIQTNVASGTATVSYPTTANRGCITMTSAVSTYGHMGPSGYGGYMQFVQTGAHTLSGGAQNVNISTSGEVQVNAKRVLTTADYDALLARVQALETRLAALES